MSVNHAPSRVSLASKIEPAREIIRFRFPDKRLQKERGSISKAWSYPERAVFYLKCLYTHIRRLANARIDRLGEARAETPAIDRDVTRSSTQISFTSLLRPFAMPGFLDISSQRMACALLLLSSSFPSLFVFSSLCFFFVFLIDEQCRVSSTAFPFHVNDVRSGGERGERGELVHFRAVFSARSVSRLPCQILATEFLTVIVRIRRYALITKHRRNHRRLKALF